MISNSLSVSKVPTFELGRTVITRSANDQLTYADVSAAMERYIACDWGDCSEEDREANDMAIQPETPDRILAVYHSTKGIKFWIITEYDRSVTTILLPSDY